MPRCCGGSSCACLIQSSGTQISITGSGTAGDPYVVHGAIALQVADNSVFNLSLSGAGSTASPWILGVDFAASAKLDDLPDVQITSQTNGQVVGWDSALSRWTNRAPTTAASGSVQHDTALVGDGSAGSPLGINEDSTGFLATAAGGLGLSDTGKNRIVRHFASSAARALATPLPDLNALSMLDDHPGRIDYYTGVAWAEYGQFTPDFGTGQLLALSGTYSTSVKATLMVRQISATTDGSGYFEMLSVTDLSGKAGVLGCWFQPTLSSVFGTIVETTTTTVRGHAYRLTDGSAHATQPVSGVVLALVY